MRPAAEVTTADAGPVVSTVTWDKSVGKAVASVFSNDGGKTWAEGRNIRFEVERFLRRLGYRLVLQERSHPSPPCFLP